MSDIFGDFEDGMKSHCEDHFLDAKPMAAKECPDCKKVEAYISDIRCEECAARIKKCAVCDVSLQ